MWSQLELLSHIGSGLGCLAYSLMLLQRQNRQTLHSRFAWFLLAHGIAMVARATHWVAPNDIASRVAMLGFALFPLLLALFFESLLQRSIHIRAKLFLLGSTLFFVSTHWTQFALQSMWWSVLLLSTHLGIVVYLTFLTHDSWQKAEPGPIKTLYGATLTVCLIAPWLMGTDWALHFGRSVPRLGAIPTVLVLYFGAYSLHAVGEWRLRHIFWRQGVATTSALFLAALLWLLRPQQGLSGTLAVMLALLLCFMLVEPLRLARSQSRAQRADLLFERLNALSLHSPDSFLQALRYWPELHHVELLQLDHFDPAERQRILRYFEINGSIAEHAEIRRQHTLTRSHKQLLAIEQLLHVMDTHQVQYLAQIGPQGEMLAISFSMGLDQDTYRRFLSVLSMLGKLLYSANPEAYKRLTTNDFPVFDDSATQTAEVGS